MLPTLANLRAGKAVLWCNLETSSDKFMNRVSPLSSRNKSSGFRNVYRTSSGRWYAKVTKNGKILRSKIFDDFDRANLAAKNLRLQLGV